MCYTHMYDTNKIFSFFLKLKIGKCKIYVFLVGVFCFRFVSYLHQLSTLDFICINYQLYILFASIINSTFYLHQLSSQNTSANWSPVIEVNTLLPSFLTLIIITFVIKRYFFKMSNKYFCFALNKIAALIDKQTAYDYRQWNLAKT